MTEQGFTKEESAPGALASADAVRGTSAHPAYTPGPWKALPDRVISTETYDTVAAIAPPVNGVHTVLNPKEEAANARLIAAAPELLEALRPNLLRDVVGLLKALSPPDPLKHIADLELVIEKQEAAIAKATNTVAP